MSQYFSKKTLVSLALFSFLAYSQKPGPQVFKCSPQALDALCNIQNPVTVCALDDDNQYLTFKSACEACGHQDTVSYTEGPCSCPQVPCAQNQTCADGRCINIEVVSTKQLVEITRKLLSKEKHKEAIPLIKKMIEQRPEDSYPLYLGALASFGDNKNEQTLKYIKKAITIDSKLPDYYIIRGRAFAELRQHEQAQKQFQKALSLGFKDIGVISFYQAQNLLIEKKTDEAIKKYEEAIKLHPEKTSWYLRKALAHSINKQQRMAVISCKQGLKIDPNNEQILSFMKQFEIMHEDKEQDLEDTQERNLQASNNTKQPDPELINKFIAEKQQEKRMQFDRKRLAQKKKKQQEEQIKKQQEQEKTQSQKEL